MLFGTYPIAPGNIPDLEIKTSERMQDFFLGFVEDPVGPPAAGWPAYLPGDAGGGKVARFGADGEILQIVDGDEVEGACHIPGYVYNTTP
jgi:hypothetical protein